MLVSGWGVKSVNSKEENYDDSLEGVIYLQAIRYNANCKNLDPNKLYTDSCATHHYNFFKEIFKNVSDTDAVSHGHCNALMKITI